MSDEAAWRRDTLEPALRDRPERRARFERSGGEEVERLHTEHEGEADAIGFPGEHPFTRGIYPTMYRGRLWTMRQYAGFGTAEETNRRYRYLLDHGQTGLSVAFDLPTQMGYDSDHPMAAGEVGRVGVAIATLDDMRTLFDGIPLERVSVSMTINSTAAILLAFYVALADERGVDRKRLTGTVQNDVLRSTSPAARTSTRSSPACASSPTSSTSARARFRAGIRSRSAATTSARRARRPRRRSRSRSPTRSSTCAAHSTAASISRASPRACPSFSPRTTTSSRRSRSSGRRDGSGRV
jgi:methylmalonyl-CoA mutase N-terminal domain/subunit